jgi:Uma2 family endonuclease
MATAVRAQSLRLVAPDGEIIGDTDILQGLWTLEQYLRLTEHSNRLFEFDNGSIEVLPMPTDEHQDISGFLYAALREHMKRIGGKVLYSPIPLQLNEEKVREPDLMLVLDANDPRRQKTRWLGADLVVEIVSPSSRALDKKVKRTDYAEAGITEYWIVDPANETVTVLRLEGNEYVEHGVFRRGETATSPLLEGFGVAVDQVFNVD